MVVGVVVVSLPFLPKELLPLHPLRPFRLPRRFFTTIREKKLKTKAGIN